MFESWENFLLGLCIILVIGILYIKLIYSAAIVAQWRKEHAKKKFDKALDQWRKAEQRGQDKGGD